MIVSTGFTAPVLLSTQVSRQTCNGSPMPNYIIIMRGKKYAKQRTGKSTPHHDIFVVRYYRNAYTYRARTRSLKPTESTPLGSTAWSVLRAVIRREAFLFLFILVDTATHCDRDSPWTSCVNDYTVLVMWRGENNSFFRSFLSSIDKSLYLALLYFSFFYYMPVFQSNIGDDDKALDWWIW